MTEVCKIITGPSGIYLRDTDPPTIGCRCCDEDFAFTAPADIVGDWLNVLGCRKQWCWRISGWGNTEEDEIPGWCRLDGHHGPVTWPDAVLGNDEQDYFGIAGEGGLYAFYPS